MRAIVLLILLSICAYSTYAQSMVIQSSASFINDSATSKVIGGNSYVSLYPLGSTFQTLSNGTYFCAPSAAGNSCGGLSVQVRVNAGSVPYVGAMSYASPTQINVVLPQIPASDDYLVYIRYVSSPLVDERFPLPVYIEKYSIQPFLATATIDGETRSDYIVGSLYAWDGVSQYAFHKSLTVGSNPRIVNGLSTIPQVYFTGVNDYTVLEEIGLTLGFFGFLANTPAYQESTGVFVTNVPIPNLGWSAGLFAVTPHYGGTSQFQSFTKTGYIKWQN